MMHETQFEQGANELAPDIVERIRDVVVKTEFVPDVPIDKLKISDVTTGETPAQSYLIETPDVDLVVHENHSLQALGYGVPVSRTVVTGNPCFELNGQLQKKYRTVNVPSQNVPDRTITYLVHSFPSSEGYNRVMQAQGLHPGIDTFKAVPVDESDIPAVSAVVAAARGEVLNARKDPVYIEHDPDPEAHLHAWWSTPEAILKLIKENAGQALASGEPGRIDEFSGGLERLQNFTRQLVQPLYELMQNKWADAVADKGLIVEARSIVQRLSNFDPTLFYGPEREGVEVFSAVCVPLVQLGLITRMPIVKVDRHRPIIETIDWRKGADGVVEEESHEIQRAETEVLPIVAMYAVRIVDMMAKSNGRGGSQLALELQAGLSPDSIMDGLSI
jgi:hypothetical protein